VLRLKVSDISLNGRATRGVNLMKLPASDLIASLARLRE